MKSVGVQIVEAGVAMFQIYSTLRIMLLLITIQPGRSQVHVSRKVHAWFGTDVTLTCRIETTETVTQVSWQKKVNGSNENFLTRTKDGEENYLTPYSRKMAFLSKEDKDGSIIIHRVALTDEGIYVCVFNTFPAGALPGEITLQISVLPAASVVLKQQNVAPLPDIVAEGLAISAKPAPAIKWITNGINYTVKEDATQHSNGTVSKCSLLYMIPSLNLYGRVLTCVVYQPELSTEEQRNITIKVTMTNIQYAPQSVHVDVQRKDDGFPQFECQSNANPAANYTWRRDNESIPEDVAQVTSQTLSFLKGDSNIKGLYICEASNIAGVQEGSVYLHQYTGHSKRYLLGAFISLFVISLMCNVLFLVYLYWKRKQRRGKHKAHFKRQTEVECYSLEDEGKPEVNVET